MNEMQQKIKNGRKKFVYQNIIPELTELLKENSIVTMSNIH